MSRDLVRTALLAAPLLMIAGGSAPAQESAREPWQSVPEVLPIVRLLPAFRPLLITATPLVQGQETGARASRARVVVEPEFLATRDGDNAHVELHVAANPRRPRNLIGGAITHTRPDGSSATKVYATFDGGQTWTDTSFPEQIEHGGGDPQVAFTPAGTALFATLMTGPDDTGRTRAFLHVYRSEDGGRNWSRPADLGVSYDHEMIAVDHTTGRYAGRIYLSALYTLEYKLGLFRSDDDGRTFIGPAEFFEAGGEELGANVLPMAVFRDGTLLLTFHDFPLGAERQNPGPRSSHFFTLLSEDGGVSFSEPRPGPDEIFPSYQDGNMPLAGDAAIAIDTSRRYPDRAYRLWNDTRSGPHRIWITTSDDRGASWSEPRMIDPEVPADSQQFLPAAAVNADGVLGVSWNDSRDVPGENAFRRYFSASLDGGDSFLPAMAVSTQLSRPHGAGNLAVTPTTFVTPTDDGAVRMILGSAAGRWGNGGDYAALAADAEGVFHPFWADSRTGTYQGWTARVRVVEFESAESEATAPEASSSEEPVDVTQSVEFLNDPSRFDPKSGELELSIRLKNTSDRLLRGPLTLTIRKFGSGMGDELREWIPTVLNAANGAANDGASFVFDAALGSERTLAPGGVTGPVLIRMRVADPLRIPDMHLVVSALRER